MQMPTDDELATLPLDDFGSEPGVMDQEDELEALLKQQQAAEQAIKSALGQRLSGEFAKRKGQRSEIEKRWLRDIRQYNGLYEPDFENALKERKFASRVFVPLTRRIGNIVEARLGDLLFPTDDRNFVVEASPIPELADAEEFASKLGEQPVDAGGAMIPASSIAAAVRELRDEATRRATNMQRLIDDQLKEADYPTSARKAIHDAVVMGTGVIKGPFPLATQKKRWSMAEAGPMLTITESIAGSIKRVDPWNWYPDMSACEVSESPDFFELHRMNPVQLAKLAKDPSFDAEAIKAILTVEAGHTTDSNQNELREAAGTVGVDDSRFNIVEFNGAISADELVAMGVELEDDALTFYNGTVWFSEFTALPIKASLAPLDTDDTLYSAFNWQIDAACIFGYGLCHELRDMQESANSTFRAAMDNMGLSVGPQVVVNSKKITPMNNSWAIEPNKIWDLTDSSIPVSQVFGFFQIDSRMGELLNLFNLIKQNAEEIGGPQMAMQGADAPSYLQTATGASIAYNAANIWMRRAVKLWDDQVTIPRVRSFVNWNMQYSEDEEVKGDISVLARGTSALLEAEGQVQRIQLLAQASEQMGIPLRNKVKQLRQMATAMRLDPEDLLPSDDEVKAIEEQMAAQAEQQPQNPELERIRIREAEIADNQEERAFKLQLSEQNNNMRESEIASRENLTIEQARIKYGFDREKMSAEMQDRKDRRDNETQKFNAEMAVKVQKGSGI